MGKIRRQRQKYHTSLTSSKNSINDNDTSNLQLPNVPLLFNNKANIFGDLKISFNDLKKSLNDDSKSVKSFKSLKSEISDGQQLSKKEKIILRREFILNKISVVDQARKTVAAKKKREKTVITGDLMPLHDALPSLDSLLKTTSLHNDKKNQLIVKKKPIEKKIKRERNTVNNVKIFKTLISNKEFKKNPLKMMTEIINTNILKHN